MTINEILILSLFLVFALPFAVWRLAGGRITLPLVVVQIVAGIALGPGIFGAVAPEWHAALFRPEVIGALGGIALWAVMLFVFLAGLELDLSEAWAQRRETGIAAGLALAVPLAAGAGAAALLLTGPGWSGEAAHRWQLVLGVGMACAVTALPILVLFLSQLDLLRAPLGQRILRYASLDDVAIWAVLALILLDWDRVGRQAGFILVFLTAAPLVRRLVQRIRPMDRWPVALIWMIAASLLSDWAGLHFMVGAFLSGAVLEARWFGEDRIEGMRQAVLILLMPVFFLSTGLRTSWSLGGPTVLLVGLALLAVSVAGKLAGVALAGRILGWSGRDIWQIGWLLQTKALIMILFANVLLDKGVISAATFTALLIMAVGSTLLTMPVVSRSLGRGA